jgi:hypothetical protein
MSEEADHVAAEHPPPCVVSSFRSVWRIRQPRATAPPMTPTTRITKPQYPMTDLAVVSDPSTG